MSRFGELLADQFGRHGDRAVLRAGTSVASGHDLLRHAQELHQQARATARSATPLVLIDQPLGLETVGLIVAAIVSNFSVCCLDPAWPREFRSAVGAILGPDLLLSNGKLRPAEQNAGNAVLAARDRRIAVDASPGYVALTSGTTSANPRGVLKPWDSVVDFLAPGAEALDLDRGSTWAELVSPAYDMAMTNLMIALAAGARVAVSNATADQFRPLTYLRRTDASHVRLSPRFIDLFLQSGSDPQGDRKIHWASGGDRLGASQVADLLATGSVCEVVNTYGTSETIGFASFARFTVETTVDELRGAATIGPGRVAQWTTTLEPHSDEMVLVVNTPPCAAGYLFGAADRSAGWTTPYRFRTADIGCSSAGNLYVLGRRGRTVKRGGQFVYLAEIDGLVHSQSGVSCYSTTISDRIFTVVEGTSAQAAVVRDFLLQQRDRRVLPDEIIAVPELPRGGSGKIMERVLRAQLAELSE